jgi:hypothetical protein
MANSISGGNGGESGFGKQPVWCCNCAPSTQSENEKARSCHEVTRQEALDKQRIRQNATMNLARVECRQCLDAELVIPRSPLSTVLQE